MSPRDGRIWRHANAVLQARYDLGRRVHQVRDGEDYDADGFDRFVADADREYDRQCDRVRAWREAREQARAGIAGAGFEPAAFGL